MRNHTAAARCGVEQLCQRQLAVPVRAACPVTTKCSWTKIGYHAGMDGASQDGVQVETSAEKQSAHQQNPSQLLQGSSHQGMHISCCPSFQMLSASSDAFYRSGVRGEDMLHSAHCMTKQPVAYIVMLCLAFVKLIVQPKMAMPTPCDT